MTREMQRNFKTFHLVESEPHPLPRVFTSNEKEQKNGSKNG